MDSSSAFSFMDKEVTTEISSFNFISSSVVTNDEVRNDSSFSFLNTSVANTNELDDNVQV